MAILEVSHIEKHFGRTNVLKDVSFSMEEGTALAIIGSSGSGKTTLLRCLNFLEKPDGGKISVSGETLFDAGDISTQKESEIRSRNRKGCGSAQKASAFWHGISVFQSVSTVYGITECDACGTASGTGTSGLQAE